MKEGKIIDFKNYNKKDCLSVVTLFSGYGSQELALQYLDIEHRVIANSDINKNANKVYDVLHKTELGNLGDITKIDENNFPECDLLTYSFPCQSLSLAGKLEGIKEGTESGLLLEVERILTVNRPKYLMMENVRNLVSKKFKPQFEKHLTFLKELGYATAWKIYNAVDYGCPQNRERVIMMAELGGCERELMCKLNDAKENKIERKPLKSILEGEFDENFIIDKEYTPFENKQESNCKVVATINGINYRQVQGVYSIEAASPCLTKTARVKIMTEKNQIRYLTAREAYRLMGVIEEDIDLMLSTELSTNQHNALAGNSICVEVLKVIFYEFFKARATNKLWENQGLRRAA